MKGFGFDRRGARSRFRRLGCVTRVSRRDPFRASGSDSHRGSCRFSRQLRPTPRTRRRSLWRQWHAQARRRCESRRNPKFRDRTSHIAIVSRVSRRATGGKMEKSRHQRFGSRFGTSARLRGCALAPLDARGGGSSLCARARASSAPSPASSSPPRSSCSGPTSTSSPGRGATASWRQKALPFHAQTAVDVGPPCCPRAPWQDAWK